MWLGRFGSFHLPNRLQISCPHIGTQLRSICNRNRIRVLILLPVQCKMARAAIGWGVRDLAREANVSPDTIARLERGDPLKENTITIIRKALEAAGVEFIPKNGGGPGVRLKQ